MPTVDDQSHKKIKETDRGPKGKDGNDDETNMNTSMTETLYDRGDGVSCMREKWRFGREYSATISVHSKLVRVVLTEHHTKGEPEAYVIDVALIQPMK